VEQEEYQEQDFHQTEVAVPPVAEVYQVEAMVLQAEEVGHQEAPARDMDRPGLMMVADHRA
jgi:hypothetical protein